MAITEEEAKANIERQNKIAQVYRDKQELDALQEELDTAYIKFDVNKTQEQNQKEIIAPIQKKLNAAKKKLKSRSNNIMSSGDNKLVSEFKSTLNEDKDLSSAIKGNNKKKTYSTSGKELKEKTGNMADNKRGMVESNLVDYKGNKIKVAKNPTKKDIEKLRFELKRIELSEPEGKESAKYQSFNRVMHEQVVLPTLKEEWGNRKRLAQEKFDAALTEDDLVNAKKELDSTEQIYDVLNIDRSKGGWEGGKPITEEATTSFDRFIREINKIEKQSYKDEPIVNEIPETSEAPVADDKTTTGTAPEETITEQKSRIDDIDPVTGEIIKVDEYGDPIDYEARAAADAKALEDFDAIQAEQFQFEYGPDSKSQTDVFGYLGDAARGIMGMKGATMEVPTYERGTMFQTAMGEAERRRDEGLSPDEINYRRQLAETGYAYDVKNIRRGAGGSAGAYLGNLGRAQTQLYGQYGQLAATDEATRRLNRQNFQQMALQDEQINRQIFQDELSQTMATKEAGAGLVQDALRNIKERRDYEKQYGKGSPYYNYLKSKTKDMESSAFYREKGKEENLNKARRDLVYQAEQSANELAKRTSLNPGEVGSTAMPSKQSDSDVVGASAGGALVESVVSPSENKDFGDVGEYKKQSPSPVKTSEDIPSDKPSREEAAANIEKGKREAKPKELKAEMESLKEAKKYGGLTDDQKARLKELKVLTK